MRWQGRRASTNVIDKRRVGKKTIAGGGLGFVGLALVIGLLGGDPTPLLNEGLSRMIESSSYAEKLPQEEEDRLASFVSVVLAETENTWQKRFADSGSEYPLPEMVLFSGAVDSACGYANAAMGPFYCPNDQRIYLDVNFFYDLENDHDAPGDFAQAYVIAHEVGHHVQNVLGVLELQSQARSRSEANQLSIRTELMADCFAGIWAQDTQDLLEDNDIKEALNAATQIGDDRLQKKSQGYVVPDSFTHGTGEQRYEWFQRGYNAKTLKDCNSFKTDI